MPAAWIETLDEQKCNNSGGNEDPQYSRGKRFKNEFPTALAKGSIESGFHALGEMGNRKRHRAYREREGDRLFIQTGEADPKYQNVPIPVPTIKQSGKRSQPGNSTMALRPKIKKLAPEPTP